MKTLKKLIAYCWFFFAMPALIAQSVLQQGEWAQVQVSESGVYKITYEDVVAMGFAHPTSIQIFGNGTGELPLVNTEQLPATLHEIAIAPSFAQGTPFSAGDYVLFYADVPRNWQFNESSQIIDYQTNSYSDKNYYFIRINSGVEPLRIQQKPESSDIVSKTITMSDDVQVYEKDDVNLQQTGKLWLEFINEKNISFSLPNLVNTESVTMKTQVAARHTTTANFAITVNGQQRNDIVVRKNTDS